MRSTHKIRDKKRASSEAQTLINAYSMSREIAPNASHHISAAPDKYQGIWPLSTQTLLYFLALITTLEKHPRNKKLRLKYPYFLFDISRFFSKLIL